MGQTQFDAIVVGAGFSGIYQLYRLRKMGLSVRVIEMGSDVGGTWYWNRYPGAMSDTYSFVYRYSWDKDDLQTYPWSNRYVKQPEILGYLQHVVAKYGLRENIEFSTQVQSAEWSEELGLWRASLDSGDVYLSRYLVTALGLLSKPHYPDIAGIDSFAGTKCHTAAWPQDLDLSDKRVGIIGNGSTGVQVITDIAKRVKSLLSFQRHPQYSVPSGDGPITAEQRRQINADYDKIWIGVRQSAMGAGVPEARLKFSDVHDLAEQNKIFESLWQEGSGFRFMFGGFSDIIEDKSANEAACEFIRRKIDQIVKDPVKARRLKPHDAYSRRPLCDGGYYEQFNRDHVDIIDLQETPIVRIVPKGILTADGVTHELDVLVFATGFDVIDGNYNRLDIRGREGRTLRAQWDIHGPAAYLGCFVPHFPNLFLIMGPQGPFTNVPPTIETQVDLISGLIERAEKARMSTQQTAIIEALPEAEQEWRRVCEKEAEGKLFGETKSWIFGHNIPGKKLALRFYFGGLQKYLEVLRERVGVDLVGFREMVATVT